MKMSIKSARALYRYRNGQYSDQYITDRDIDEAIDTSWDDNDLMEELHQRAEWNKKISDALMDEGEQKEAAIQSMILVNKHHGSMK